MVRGNLSSPILFLTNWIYYSTIAGVFSGILMLMEQPVHFRVFDVLMLFNLPIILFLLKSRRMSWWPLLLFLFCTGSGAIGILTGTDTVPLVAKEVVGLTISAFYAYYFFRFINYDYLRAFDTYALFAVWFGAIGLPFWIVRCYTYHELLRFAGIALEPSQIGVLLLPAFYWYAYKMFTARQCIVRCIFLLLLLILSGSSLAFISLILGGFFLLASRMKHLIIAPIVGLCVASAVYSHSEKFRTRVDDTLYSIVNQDVADVNISTYAVMSNLFITRQVLARSPLIGFGIGSHLVSHERFLASVPGIRVWLGSGVEDFNAANGASYLVRCLSEFGYVGLFGSLFFLYYFYVPGGGRYSAVSNAILICFILKLLRDGAYFPPEQFFFILIYVLNYHASKGRLYQETDSHGPMKAVSIA